MMNRFTTATAAAVLLMGTLPAMAQDAPATETPMDTMAAESDSVPGEVASLIAELKTPEGTSVGTVTAAPTPSGVMLVTIEMTGAPAGVHGVHIHETGTCTPPDFASAGGHIAGDHDHGAMSPTGIHSGDLPNVHVPESGELMIEYFAPTLTAEMMTDEDGAAFVMHADPDDYTGQPAGNSGDRLVCGVFAAVE